MIPEFIQTVAFCITNFSVVMLLQPLFETLSGTVIIRAVFQTVKNICIEHSAEGERFELSVPIKGYNGFRDRPVQPLWHPSNNSHSDTICGTNVPKLYLKINSLRESMTNKK